VLAFCDTSSLLKLFIDEKGSATMRRLVQDSTVAVASLAYAEAYAAFSRQHREGLLKTDQLDQLKRQFASEWVDYFEVHFGAQPQARVADLCHSWPLRGADAVHVATALACRIEGFPVLFVTSDQRQLAAAVGVGLNALNPSAE